MATWPPESGDLPAAGSCIYTRTRQLAASLRRSGRDEAESARPRRVANESHRRVFCWRIPLCSDGREEIAQPACGATRKLQSAVALAWSRRDKRERERLKVCADRQSLAAAFYATASSRTRALACHFPMPSHAIIRLQTVDFLTANRISGQTSGRKQKHPRSRSKETLRPQLRHEGRARRKGEKKKKKKSRMLAVQRARRAQQRAVNCGPNKPIKGAAWLGEVEVRIRPNTASKLAKCRIRVAAIRCRATASNGGFAMANAEAIDCDCECQRWISSIRASEQRASKEGGSGGADAQAAAATACQPERQQRKCG